MRLWIFPPALRQKAKQLARITTTYKALSPPEHPTPLSDIIFSRPGQIHWVPTDKIVGAMGQSFSAEQHHFVRYLESGSDALESFYRIHQPTTALEFLFTYQTFPDQPPTKVTDAPWHTADLTATYIPTQPENFGPVSGLQLATEAARLNKVRHSIEKHGFRPGYAQVLEGHITGRLFLHDDSDFRICIGHGNHRAAVLHHLGWKQIPIQPNGPQHVRLSDLEKWPGVVDGRFTPETARAMFEAFFRPRHQQLLPGW